MNWRDALSLIAQENQPHVLVTVLQVKGSAPRDTGAKMVVTEGAIHDTIGGGRLEQLAIGQSRELLANTGASAGTDTSHDDRVRVLTREFNLASDAAQCCGGRVSLLFECFQPAYAPVVLCGAGHVGQALLAILAELPVKVTVLDTRREWLEKAASRLDASRSAPTHQARVKKTATTSLSMRADTRLLTAPHEQIASCDAGSVFLVMTHSHDLDFELCEAVLSRPSRSWCGLIASRSKAASFRKRLQRLGFTEQELAALVAPVGLRTDQMKTASSKEPMAVAVSIAAQLLALPEFNKQWVGEPASAAVVEPETNAGHPAGTRSRLFLDDAE